jgi:hypothetical protein
MGSPGACVLDVSHTARSSATHAAPANEDIGLCAMHLPRAPAASRLDGTPKRAVHRRRCIIGSSIFCQSVLDPGSGATGFGSFGRTAGFGCFGGGAGDALASAI